MMSVVEQPGFRGRIVDESVGVRVFLFGPGVEEPAAVAGAAQGLVPVLAERGGADVGGVLSYPVAKPGSNQSANEGASSYSPAG